MTARSSVTSLPADGCEHAVGVGGVRHDVETVLVHPPHDDVVEHRGVVFVEKVGVLGASGGDLSEVVGESGLEETEGVVTHHPDRAKVADVKAGRRPPAGQMLGHGPGRVRQRHLPAAEVDQSRSERLVLVPERAVPEGHPANVDVATPRRCFSIRLTMSRR